MDIIIRNGVIQKNELSQEQLECLFRNKHGTHDSTKKSPKSIVRDKILTDREEWEHHFGGVRISLDALNNKKKPEGPLKKNYADIPENKIDMGEGPYCDIFDAHLHIWKKGTKIKNFTCEQNPKRLNIEYVQSDDSKEYCSICHKKKRNDNGSIIKQYSKVILKTTKELVKESIYDKWFRLSYKTYWRNRLGVKQEKEIEKDNFKTYTKWFRIVYKLMYQPVLYSISPHFSLLKYKWELTYYQKFRLEYPNYKTECKVFLHPDAKFYHNYLTIE